MEDFFAERPVLVIGGLVAVIALGVGVFTCYDTVEAGHVGVVTSLGAVRELNLEEGFTFKAPWETVYSINTRVDTVHANAAASSRDLQDITVGITVNYYAKPDHGWELYRYLGGSNDIWEKVVFSPAIQECVKAVTARYTAEELITKRAEVRDEIEKILLIKVDAITAAKVGSTDRADTSLFHITQVSINELKFAESYTNAIAAKQVAEQDALKAENELERERVNYQRQVAKAEAEKNAAAETAEAIRIMARAEADAAKLRADGEAEAYRLNLKARMEVLDRVKELGIDPAFYEWMQRWDGILPRIMGGDSANTTLLIPEGLKD